MWYRLNELGLEITKPHQSAPVLVPKSQAPAFEALSKSNNLGDPIEFGGDVEASLKPVVGNSAA